MQSAAARGQPLSQHSLQQPQPQVPRMQRSACQCGRKAEEQLRSTQELLVLCAYIGLRILSCIVVPLLPA